MEQLPSLEEQYSEIEEEAIMSFKIDSPSDVQLWKRNNFLGLYYIQALQIRWGGMCAVLGKGIIYNDEEEATKTHPYIISNLGKEIPEIEIENGAVVVENDIGLVIDAFLEEHLEEIRDKTYFMNPKSKPIKIDDIEDIEISVLRSRAVVLENPPKIY